jgi:hemerythrin
MTIGDRYRRSSSKKYTKGPDMNTLLDQAFCTGIRKIDQQHIKVINFLTKLTEQDEIKLDSELLSEIMTELIRYSEDHLKTEEEYMRQYGYPDYESHKKLHSEYKRKVAEFSVGILDKNHSTPSEMISFLSHWWTNHIRNVDMKYKDFFANKGVR